MIPAPTKPQAQQPPTQSKPQPESKGKTAKQQHPQTEPQSQPQPKPKPKPKKHSKQRSQPGPQGQPQGQRPEPQAQAHPQPEAQPKGTAQPQTSKPQASHKTGAQLQGQPKPKPQPRRQSQPQSQPQPPQSQAQHSQPAKPGTAQPSKQPADGKGPGFASVVLKWSCKELVSNPNMLSNKVKPLPQAWSPGKPGVRDYATAAWWLLQEEVRAQLQQTLERSGELVWEQVVVDTHDVPPKALDEAAKSGLIALRVDSASGGACAGSPGPAPAGPQPAAQRRGQLKGLQGCKPTDIVLLSSEPVTKRKQWLNGSVVHSLGLVTKLQGSDGVDGGDVPAVVQLFAHTGSPMYERLGLGASVPAAGKPPAWHMALLGTAATSMRTWDALQSAQRAAQAADAGSLSRLLLRLVNPSSSGLVRSQPQPAGKAAAPVARLSKQHRLNASQAAAVAQVLAAVPRGQRQQSQPQVQLVQGPPGTGKTQTIVTTLLELLSCGCDVLMTAPTNVAVQEVASRFLRALAQPDSPALRGLQLPAMSDIALLAAKDAVEDSSELQAISTTARAMRLKQVLCRTGTLAGITAGLVNTLAAPDKEFGNYLAQRKDKDASEGDKVAPEAWLWQALPHLLMQLQSAVATVLADLPLPLCRLREQLQAVAASIKDAIAAMGGATQHVKAAVYSQLSTVHDSSSVEQEGLRAEVLQQAEQLVSQLRLLASSVHGLSSVVPAVLRTGTIRDIEKLLLCHARVVFTTVSSAGRKILHAARGVVREQGQEGKLQGAQSEQCVCACSTGFDVCFVDEASQLPELHMGILLQGFPDLRLAVLVGDPKQPPATVISKLAQEHGYARSLQERLHACGVPMHMLDTQYRMHPEISQHPAAAFYGGRLKNGPSLFDLSRGAHVCFLPLWQKLGPYHALNTDNGKDKRCPRTGSTYNKHEAKMVQWAVEQLAREYQAAQQSQSQPQPLSIGVISPYAAQVRLLSELLQGLLGSQTSQPGQSDQHAAVQLEISTVDGFQGREMDVIMVSTVRANTGGNVGFLKDERRLNVAVTRGRHAVWIFSHTTTLKKKSESWKELFNNADDRELHSPVSVIQPCSCGA